MRRCLHTERALNLDESDADIFLQLGHAHKVKGNLAEAISFYNRGYAIEPAHPDLMIELHNLSPESLAAEDDKGPRAADLAELRTLMVTLRNHGVGGYWIFQEAPFNTSCTDSKR